VDKSHVAAGKHGLSVDALISATNNCCCVGLTAILLRSWIICLGLDSDLAFFGFDFRMILFRLLLNE